MSLPLHYKIKANRIDEFRTFADHKRALLNAVSMQDQSAADDLIYRFAGGAEPVRRIALENEIVHAATVPEAPANHLETNRLRKLT